MPRELFATGVELVAFLDGPLPALKPDSIRIRVRHAAAKHGTEMSFYKGYGAPRGDFDGDLRVFDNNGRGVHYPFPLGNMCVGEVVERGAEARRFAVGETVFAYGSFREEHVWQEAHVWSLPPGVPWQSAVCLDPADFALGAVRDGHLRIGDACAVFGMGAIGLMAVQIAKHAGAHPVIAVDPIAARREIAKKVGADIVLDPSAVDAGVEIKLATGRRGADVTIEYSGSVRALQAALRGAAYEGTVVAGAYPPVYPAGLDFGAESHMNRIKLVFSRACSEPNPDHPNWNEGRIFDVAWRLLREGMITGVPIVRPIVPFDALPAEYPKIATNGADYVKLGVDVP